MIIEAGYDLWELMLHRLENEPADVPALWMVTMTDELRLLSVKAISNSTHGVLTDHVEEILGGLVPDVLPVAYFVLAHRSPRLGEGIAEHVYNGDQALLERTGIDERTFLGRLILDGEYLYSSAPRFSFRDYLMDHLPRAAVVKGPHPFDCACFACSQYNDKLADARTRAEAIVGGTLPP